MTTVVHFRGTREEARRIALSMGAMLSGSQPDPQGIGQGFRNTLGFLALSDIKDAYVTKADGGTDEMAIQWAPLSPVTIAGRRVGEQFRKARARKKASIRKREEARILKRFSLSLPEGEARKRARSAALAIATAEMARTLRTDLANRDVQILRDTGILLNSLTPGTLSGQTYTKPSLEGGDEQTFDASAGQFIVGTRVKYAGVHQNGSPGKNIPARPFLPDDDNPIPEVWWERWLAGATKGLAAAAVVLFRGGGR